MIRQNPIREHRRQGFRLLDHFPYRSIELLTAHGTAVPGIGKRHPTKAGRRDHHHDRRSGQTPCVPSVATS